MLLKLEKPGNFLGEKSGNLNICHCLVESKGVKKPKTAKGCHSSRNAYMLVYQRKSDTVEGMSLYRKFRFLQYY